MDVETSVLPGPGTKCIAPLLPRTAHGWVNTPKSLHEDASWKAHGTLQGTQTRC